MTASDARDLAGQLSREELVEAERIGHERRRREWMLGRFATKRLAIALGLCTDPRDCAVPSRGVQPKLLLHGEPSTLHLSLSHSGDIAAATISTCRIGIDIQKHRSIDIRATRFFLRDEESALAADLDDSTLLDLWSAKEAALKASGVNRYRQVTLRERRLEPGRTTFRFDAGSISGDVETTWLAGKEMILAVARGIS